MSNKIFQFDVAVVGGGPSGMIAALRAAEKGARVVLVEKKNSLGTKLLMTGGGRCNIAQAEFDLKKLASEYKNGRFLLPSFRIFGPTELLRYFERIGISLKTEKNNRVFPVSNKASDVTEIFRKKLLENGVNFFMESEVEDIKFSENIIDKLVLKGKREIIAKNYIVATGGKSYPQSGSTGQGFEWAEKLGHKIETPKPSLVPIIISSSVIPASEPESRLKPKPLDPHPHRNDKTDVVNEKLTKGYTERLQGISLSDVGVNVYQNKKKVFSKVGDLIFTHFGLSGPTILNISGKVRDFLKNGSVTIKIDLKPHIETEKLDEIIRKDLENNSGKQLGNCLENLFSEKIREYILEVSGLDREKHAGKISRIERRKITFLIKGLEFQVKEVLGFDRAMVTSGGVSVLDVNSKTMKSRIIENLFFAGEILDVDGPTGGYNLQMCWSTGYVAGENATKF